MRDVVDARLDHGADCDYDLPERVSLRELTARSHALAELEEELVRAARRVAVPWRAIAADLGVSTTTAFRRHSHHDPIAAQRRGLRADWERAFGPAQASDQAN